jgi:hypothetical protein
MKSAIAILTAIAALLLSACPPINAEYAGWRYRGMDLAEIDPHARPCKLGNPCRFVFPMTAALNRRGDVLTLSGALGPFAPCESCRGYTAGEMYIALLRGEEVAEVVAVSYPGEYVGEDKQTEVYRFAEEFQTPLAAQISAWSLIDANASSFAIAPRKIQ